VNHSQFQSCRQEVIQRIQFFKNVAQANKIVLD